MLKDFVSYAIEVSLFPFLSNLLFYQSTILLHNDSTAYFLVSFLSACAQFIARAALYVTDNDGAIKSSAVVRSQLSNKTLDQAVYYLSTNKTLRVCSNLPGPCVAYNHTYLSNWPEDPVKLCVVVAEYTATQ